MDWKNYELEVVTPMFCAGANQKQAEVRVPSIRGQVRWWFRALGGSRHEEKQLFGGVHGDVRASAVRMRVAQPVRSTVSKNLHDVVPGGNMNHPVSYLIWPLRPSPTSDQKRGCIEPGTGFTLQVQLGTNIEAGLCERFESALHIWMLFGSLGTRSRRGFGALRPVPDRGDFPWETASFDDWAGALWSELRPFPRVAMEVYQLGRPEPSHMDALSRLGAWLKNWRAGSTRSVPKPLRWGKSDHDVAAGSTEDFVYRPVLGLPLTQRFTVRGGGPGLVVETSLPDANRWASPLLLKVVKVVEGYVPMAVFFPDLAIPESRRIQLSQRRGPTRTKTVSWSLLLAMLKESEPYPVQIYPGSGDAQENE